MGTTPNNRPASEPSSALVTALRRILRPLIRLLIAHQITLPFLTSLLKSIYVEVAEQDFPVAGKKQTDSRISLLTGVHRKDVKRLRSEAQDPTSSPASISLGAQLVGEKLFFFGKNLQDHINAGAHNLSGEKPAFFDRSVYYDQLSEESIATLAQLCNTIGMQTLLSVNEKALELQTQDKNRSGSHYRMSFGIFNYHTEYDVQPRRQIKRGSEPGNNSAE